MNNYIIFYITILYKWTIITILYKWTIITILYKLVQEYTDCCEYFDFFTLYCEFSALVYVSTYVNYIEGIRGGGGADFLRKFKDEYVNYIEGLYRGDL